jgi:heparan-sulfate lyase
MTLRLPLFPLALLLPLAAASAAQRKGPDVNALLDRLDLDRPGLEAVKAAAGNPDRAAAELLAYFRARTSVKHPVERSNKRKKRGRYAGQGALKVADDALKHIFISQRSYGPHFVGKDIDWSTKPVPDNEWLWQLHRMSFWHAMARAYWNTGDEKYAKAWCEQLVDWVQKNPNDGEHDYAWRPIEAGIRGHSWMSHYQHFLDSPHFTPDVLVTFLQSCHDHAAFLTGRPFTRNNHGLMEAEGTAFIAMMFPEFKDAETWRRKAFRSLNAQIQRQVRADGHQVEQCLNYHIGCIGWFSRTAELARMNGREDEFPPAFWNRIEAMCEVVMKLAPPGGKSAQFGDTSSPMDCARVLRKWAKVFDRDDFRHVASHGKQGRAPAQTAYALKQSGFYSIRSSWGDKAVGIVLKCGPGGYWHSQPDNGTFELWAFGRRLMPDSGTYIYHGDADGRRWFRQTRVHQTLTLDGKDAGCDARCLLWRPGDELDTLVVENKSYQGLTHRRAVLFVKKTFFVLVDEALGPATGHVDLHFQLAPGEAVFDRKAPWVRTNFHDANVLVRALPQKGLTLAKEKGQVSFHYGSREPRPAFRFRVNKAGRAGLRFVTLVVPYKTDAPETNVELLGDPKPGSRKIELAVTVGNTTATIGYEFP